MMYGEGLAKLQRNIVPEISEEKERTVKGRRETKEDDEVK